jgi:hypothetical protein
MRRNEKSFSLGSSSHNYIVSFLGIYILVQALDNFNKQFPQKRNLNFFPMYNKGEKGQTLSPYKKGGETYA